MMEDNCSREELSNEFNKLLEIGQISFCTFHQSYSYEDFVEGLRSDEEGNGFVPKDGIFKQICKTASEKIEKRGSKYEFDEENINFYKMSLGSKDGDYDIYKYCIENDCIALGKGGDVDYKNCSNKEEIKNEYLKQYPSAKSDEFDIDAMNRFKLWMEKDDIVIISYGNLKARAIGKVTGDYFYDPNTEISYSHFRKVEWLYVSDGIDVKRILNEKKFSQQSIYKFYKKDLNIENIKELISATEIDNEEKKYVLIIDEINRGNISKIFGELITLIEEDKRLGEKNQIKVTLPYSNEPFWVPSNLYIIGTMNTADRSIALLDTALRRRFEFIEYMPNPELLSENVDGINLRELLKVINKRIEFLFDRDHTIGHAFFIKDNLSFDGIVEIMNKKVIPLLQEYFYGDFEKIELILGGAGKPGDNNYFISKEEVNPGMLFNKKNISNEYPSQYKYTIVENPTKDAFINLYSDVEIED
ncbi:AAA family ATPase [Clostridium sp. BL-8]|uniref:AAA family ATPase n=1 Tax=Clostridium sp. BL-8 TaxID=349938 RepID=UPI00098C0CD4|nr:AAA family ATPase [Clostridium sp. BL-8]